MPLTPSQKRIRAVFLPFGGRMNPYFRDLARSLDACGVMVDRQRARVHMLFLPRVIRYGADVVHLHWLTQYCLAAGWWRSVAKLGLFIIQILLLQWSGRRIVWTAHDLKHHENIHPKLDGFATRFVVHRADAIIVHCPSAREQLVSRFGLSAADRAKMFVVPHGNFGESYPNTVSQSEARQRLGLSEADSVLLFLGLIRPYKGIFELLDAYARISQAGVRLVIAGKPLDDGTVGLIQQRVTTCPRVLFHPGFVPDEDIQLYMKAADVVVFPYRDILTSGALILAMGFGRVCIAPRLGFFVDALEEGGGFLYDPQDALGLETTMRQALTERARWADMGTRNLVLARRWSWQRVARLTRGVYLRTLGSGRISSRQ